MELKVNNKNCTVPFDLSAVTLGEYISYYEKYGRDLDGKLKEIQERDYKKYLASKGFTDAGDEDIETFRDLDLDNHLDQEALAWFSFWTGFDFFEAQHMKETAQALFQYRVFRYIMNESIQKETVFPQQYEWNGETWEVLNYQVTPESEMSFNEVITSKEIMRQIYKMGKGKWDAMPYLCAVFFRKKNEAFKDEFVHESSERLKLMLDLPLTYAMQVGFFLTACVNIWKNTLASSENGEEVTQNLSS